MIFFLFVMKLALRHRIQIPVARRPFSCSLAQTVAVSIDLSGSTGCINFCSCGNSCVQCSNRALFEWECVLGKDDDCTVNR